MSDQNPPGETPAGGPPPPQNPYGQPPAADPYGQPAQQPPYGQQPAYGQPAYGQPAYTGASGGDPDRRPGTVTAAGIITIVVGGLSLLLFGGLLVGLLVAKDTVLDEIKNAEGFEEANISASDALGAAVGVIGVLALWCLIATILGFLVLRRSNGARITLVVSSAVTALFSLLAIGSGVSAVNLIAAIAVIVLLFTGGAGAWFKSKGASV
jgi:hypothetical protein